MEIPEIKRQLPIGQVLEHYGLKPDRNDRLLCPFHPDKTPSLQIYPKTGTYCCFSSNCTAGTGDVIQFIERMEKCSKHEALLKATALCGGGSSPLTSTTTESKLFIEVGDELEKQAVLGKVFSYFKRALPLTKKALEYIQGRGIDSSQHEIGYNSGGLHGESKNQHLVAGMESFQEMQTGIIIMLLRNIIKLRFFQGNNAVIAGYLVIVAPNGHHCLIFPKKPIGNSP